jgi:hypothetical protein
MASPVLQFKRGALANLPGLRAGEPALTTDSFDLYVGIDSSTANNKFFGSHRFWTKGTATTGSGVNFVEGTNNGTDYITLKSPNSLAGIVTYTLPGTQGGANSVLTNDGTGTLTWGSGSNNATFSGVSTFQGPVQFQSFLSASGISTFSNTTDNSLGTTNTGAVQIAGGAVVAKNLTVGAGLSVVGNVTVAGVSTFVGSVTFQGGTINLGDANTDDINVAGEFVSNLVPNTDATYDLGNGTQRWRNANFSGIITATTFSGNATTATRANTVDTTTTTTNSYFAVPFVTNFTGTNGETVRVGIGVSVNPSTGDVKTSRDLLTGSGYLSSPGGTRAMYLFDSTGDVSFQGKVVSNSYRSGSNASNTLSFVDLDASFARNLTVVGVVTSAILSSSSLNSTTLNVTGFSTVGSVSVANLTLAGITTGINATGISTLGSISGTNLNYSGIGSIGTIQTGTIKASDGTSAITITNSTGTVQTNSDLTVGGNLYINGSTTQVNTSQITVEDRTIELGIVDGAAPSSTTTWDLGVLFNYNDGSAKKSALIWEQGDARFKLGSVISDGGGTGTTNPQITFTTYAALEIGGLWVNDCAGQSQVINCSAGVRTLENITIDAGTF